MVVYGILILLLITASLTDVRGHRIPNWLTGSAACIGIAYQTGVEGVSGLVFAAAGLGLGLALLMPFYAAGGMGAGDVKLMGAVGVLLGAKAVSIAFIVSALVGGVYAVVLLVAHGDLRETIARYGYASMHLFATGCFGFVEPSSEKEGRPRLCYGVVIALGTLISLGGRLYV